MDDQVRDRGDSHRWTVVALADGGAQVLPGQALTMEWSEGIRCTFWTRYEDLGLSALIPREMIFEVEMDAADMDAAQEAAGAVTSGLSVLLSFFVNGYVPTPEPVLTFQADVGMSEREFWQ